MFEKEAEEYGLQQALWCTSDSGDLRDAFKDGAEFGYSKAFVEADKNLKAVAADFNKANEWHYPSKGEHPKEYEDILIYFLTEDGMKDWTRGWYENDKHIFKYLSALGTQYLKTVIAWKEIVLPELKE